MMFENDINKWFEEKGKRESMPPNTIFVPSSAQVFFEAKLEEIFKQYSAARTNISLIGNNSCNYWYTPTGEDNKDKGTQIHFDSMFLETALIFYNIVVDLTWVICYVSLEYASYLKEGVVQNENANKLDVTKDTIKELESYASNPNSADNPLNYLKTQSLSAKKIVDLVFDFWNSYGDSSVRSLYNFVKHRGKPYYNEMTEFFVPKFFGLTKDDEKYATHAFDAKKVISLREIKKEIIDFDNQSLFPYCDELFNLIIKLVY